MADFSFTLKKKEEEEGKEVKKDGEEDDGDDGDDGPAPEEESTAVFTPVVKLEVVEVKTHEEDEDVVYKQRAKLFTYSESMLDKGTGKKNWNEKGVGDMKLLKHKESSRIRVLMRQEKTMKIIANHFLDPRISIAPNCGSDKSWVWIAFDFSDNELVETTFAIRFASAEIATEFKTAFVKAQDDNKQFVEGLDSKEGAKEADDAAKALETLAVKDNDDKEVKEVPKP